MSAKKSKQVSPLLSYLQLFRIPNVFTAIADVAMGFLVINRGVDMNIAELVLLILASGLLYTAGMILNDVFDYEIDKKQRPKRPLPAGRISLSTATKLGYGMLIAGVALAFVAGYLPGGDAVVKWRAGAVAIAVAAFVLLYDRVLKKTPAAPFAMGGCRFFNVLLGMSTASVTGLIAEERMWTLGFMDYQLIIAGGIAIYIAGITMFARNESETSDQMVLTTGTMIAAFGIILLVMVNRKFPNPAQLQFDNELHWALLLLLLAFTVVRRCISAILNPKPQYVQMAVKNAILSLIVIDAALTLQFAGPTFAIAIVLLLAPTLILGRWVYST